MRPDQVRDAEENAALVFPDVTRNQKMGIVHSGIATMKMRVGWNNLTPKTLMMNWTATRS